MRYAADKVKEAILHADQDVREAAVRYFANSYSADPGIMPLVIQAIEKHGFDDAFPDYFFLKDLAQSDETVCWLMRQLRTLGQPASAKEAGPVLAYVSALVHADLALLKSHEAEIMVLDALDDDTGGAIQERISFSSRTAAQLWEDLEEFCETHNDEETIASEDMDFADRLVEALARHPQACAEKVLAIIGGETDELGTWNEFLAIRLAGEMKLEAALPLIMATLQEVPDDWISDECHRAFTKIGSEAVVVQLAGAYQACDWPERISIAGTLADIHSDQAVEICLDLLRMEQNQQIKAVLLQSILFNFATEGIEPARQFILNAPLDPDVLEVRSALLTACKLMEQRFPEFDAWLEDSKNDREFRRNWDEEHPLPDESEEELEEEEYPAGPLQRPILRHHERVGRNDPCPCGSGKKFKKCCYGKDQDDINPHAAPSLWGRGSGRSTTTFPVGTVAFYGPDDKTTTKIVAGVIRREGAEPILERWMGMNIQDNPKVKRQMQEFFRQHGVKQVAMSQGNMGCPHEEGEDFPLGADCPFCPFWRGKQGSNRRD